MQPNDQTQHLDRIYLDPRGVPVHVTGYDRDKEQVIFTRTGYPHDCMRPAWQFKQFFTRVSA